MDEISLAMVQRIEEVEQKDEAQILAEIAGDTISELVYFTEDRRSHKRVPRLSYKGVMQVARDRGNIMVDDKPADITETDRDWRVVIRIMDLKRNFAIFGGAHQPKVMKINITGTGGEVVGTREEPDPFSFQKCLAKAQRNAFIKAIPESYIANCIGRYLEAQKKRGALPQNASTEPPKHQAARPPVKGTDGWNKYAEADIQTYPQLETIFWNLTKKQPKEMYAEFNVASRADMTVRPWDAFCQLKQTYMAPPEG